ncbi:Bifunctional protein FolC: Folylpolyglutamate synthase and Dihydrofolate synthase [Nitrospira sp. KM1]|uniref:bifunctional folylpolyglutamate synthase/dihydrofolate synthase n=1 Tax=Nitrospira sp. KM1 TaxID=1936990 RepID=UPI0013A70DF4|nr:folylpolyglutamate synthase/dihydrofolate synthase family protein [Nitrospira sp. KM1]BCA57023.1 Bifunctional protein FolC: Folylpolyglutamate synthase and Dihydrofolate synthase [Nitrospira sp. KM1]
MTYSDAVASLYRLQKHGIKLGLERMAALSDRLGHPERDFLCLHIAGTNGKGSTASMTASILEAAGYRVGLYTSPHLVDFRERIRINGEMIPELDVAKLTAKILAEDQSDVCPTFFECTTAMALRYFADRRVDVAVLEVGLGGRFDATNIVAPAACAITTIALDHQEYLGDTLSAIAFEKAGIIKARVPVIVGSIEGDAFRMIEDVAQERQAQLECLGRDFAIQGTREHFAYRGTVWELDGLSCTLDGAHQLDNAACAIALLEASSSRGLSVTEAAVRRGLQQVRWEGRLERIEETPLLLLDGAHNPAGAGALAAYLQTLRVDHPRRRIILVLGMMRDKDHSGFFAPLKSVVDHVVLTQAGLARSSSAHDLGQELESVLPSWTLAAGSTEAVAMARRLASADDVICVTGSLMLLGEVKALLRGCELSPLQG